MANETATPEAGAATTTEELKQKLALQIESARNRLDELQNDLENLRAEDHEGLRQKGEDIRRRVADGKERARQLRVDISNWEKEKTAHTREAIATWRQRRELRKLQNRAERAADYAVRAVLIAAVDFEEAEQAVVDALIARFDAELAAAH